MTTPLKYRLDAPKKMCVFSKLPQSSLKPKIFELTGSQKQNKIIQNNVCRKPAEAKNPE